MPTRGKAQSLSEFPPEKQAKLAVCVPELIPNSKQNSALSRSGHVLYQENPWGNTSPGTVLAVGVRASFWFMLLGAPAIGKTSARCGLQVWTRGEGLLYLRFESDGESHLGHSGAMLSHCHVEVQFDSSLAQNGFWCPSACPQGDGRDRVLGARGQAGSWGTTLLSCTLSPKQKGKRGLTPAERAVKGKPALERRG